jgi:hypothetical protein
MGGGAGGVSMDGDEGAVPVDLEPAGVEHGRDHRWVVGEGSRLDVLVAPQRGEPLDAEASEGAGLVVAVDRDGVAAGISHQSSMLSRAADKAATNLSTEGAPSRPWFEG